MRGAPNIYVGCSEGTAPTNYVIATSQLPTMIPRPIRKTVNKLAHRLGERERERILVQLTAESQKLLDDGLTIEQAIESLHARHALAREEHE